MPKNHHQHLVRRPRRGKQRIRGHWPIARRASGQGMTLTAITITAATELDADTGLLAFLDMELGDLMHIDGMALRMTHAGVLAVSFPMRTSLRGEKHPIVGPIDVAARVAIERAIFRALGLKQEVRR